MYRRYVDDIICLFNCESDADTFFEFLNTQHPNIKFTFEKQVNKQISFLDVLITNDGDQFYTSVFHKETAIGLFTNYLSFTPFSYKVGLVRTFLHPAFMISSSWFLFHEEVVKIKHYLEKNSYPLSFVDKQVKFFLENKINEKVIQIMLQTMLLSTINYLILAIFQQMSNVILIGFVNFIVKV